MSWKNIKLIFQREVRDQLRDRRTLFMVAVLPLLLYPALGIGMVQMTVTFSEQTRKVVIVGADQLPEPSLLDGDRFDSTYFEHPADVEKLDVITDRPGALEAQPPEDQELLRNYLQQVEQQRPQIEQLASVQQQLDRLPADAPEGADLLAEEKQLRQQVESWFSKAPAQVLIVFPRNFGEQYRKVSDELRLKQEGSGTLDIPRPVILHNSADEKSEIAYQRVRKALRKWDEALLEVRLRAAQLPLNLSNPVPVTSVDLAEAHQLAANVWSKIFPALLVIMSVTGAFYPAIDLGAGEKERGTMETLLISPATRTEIVLGKFLTVMGFSLMTALLNLTSMGFTGKHMLSAVGSVKSAPLGDLSFPPFSSLIWVILLAIPLAALFSALSLSLAMFARSSKEGQYYLTPLLMVTMGLTVFCLNPGIELTAYYSVLPVIGPALLLKALLLGGTSTAAAGLYAIPVLVSSFAYSLMALWWAIDQFQREDILFREAERFELGLWLKHLLREKEPTPTFAEAAVCFVIIALLQFVFLVSMQGADSLSSPVSMVKAQFVFLVATIGVPPLLMAILLTSDFRRTMKFILPSWKFVVMGVGLAVTLLPLTAELLKLLDPHLPPPPPGVSQIMQAMGLSEVPFWLSLSAFALAPAVCEEFAFRGFILSGLQRSRHTVLPIVISSLLFGLIHMIPKMQVNAALLGLVLGLLAIRSQSLLPGVIFHFLFNGMQVVGSRLKIADLRGTGWERVLTLSTEEGVEQLEFRSSTLLVCGVIATALLIWLIRSRPQTVPAPAPVEPFVGGTPARVL
ncbi:ABC transporter permease subunit/CPBP intramembrane protease [Planctomicrobium sp. SH664]|uniref:ABC transporter permease subunit/CPBP intramembrane protease n=1 Tax=Planctomicrobium sp. SH664 TaxID=3448125 RepID=UPI003F5CB4F3